MDEKENGFIRGVRLKLRWKKEADDLEAFVIYTFLGVIGGIGVALLVLYGLAG